MLSHGVAAVVVLKIHGHSSPSITLGIHAHSTLDMQTHAATVMDEIVGGIPVELWLQERTSAGDHHEAGN